MEPREIQLSEDQKLLSVYKSTGNQEHLARLYKQYSHLVFGTCMKFLKDEDAAQDAVMDIYIHLVKKAKEHEISNFKSWLYSTVSNHCRMVLRKDKKNPEIPLEEKKISQAVMETQDQAHQYEDLQIREDKLREAIEGLNEEQKLCIRLFYLESKCYKEIVTLSGYDEKKVKSCIQNGKRNLRIQLEKMLND